MRISVLKGDPDYTEHGGSFNVTLDGVVQTVCVIADSDKGEIVRYKLNAMGLPSKDRSGKFILETLKGKVSIHCERM